MTTTVQYSTEHDPHFCAMDPLSSVFSRIGALRDVDVDAADDEDGRWGLTVADDRVLSVLVLVSELKREPASFLVIVARPSHEGAEPCHSRQRRGEGRWQSRSNGERTQTTRTGG